MTSWKESRFLPVLLTPEELRMRGEQLAHDFSMRTTLVAEHKAQREAMKAELDAVDGELAKLVRIVTERAEERAVEVECRLNLALGLVEEIRTDTGDVLRTRSAEPNDRLRSQGTLFSEPSDP